MNPEELPSIVASVVSAYVGNNALEVRELPALIGSVFEAFRNTGQAEDRSETDRKPAVSVRRSVRQEAITCLECGVEVKMLRSHLRSCHQLTPETYRARWNLPGSYPMVAPGYSDKRAEIARQMGLGTRSHERNLREADAR